MTEPQEGRVTGLCTVNAPADAHACPIRIAETAETVGFSERGIAELKIVTSELCTNILKHGGRGVVRYWSVRDPDVGIVIVAEDDGPGFEDIGLARRDGVSRGVNLDSLPAARRDGLGSGLGAIERLADSVELENRPEGGARIVVFKAAG